MTEQTKEMLMLSKRLGNNLKFNRSSFEEALNEFIEDIRYAQDFITNEGTPFVQQVCHQSHNKAEKCLIVWFFIPVGGPKTDYFIQKWDQQLS